MSQIDFFALGGLGEDGKNMYCLEIDQAIYILDAGLKYPIEELYGVDAILPDYSYLVKNRSRIRGLFLSHGHEDHIGAAPKLLKELNIPVYGTHFTLAMLKDALKNQSMTIDEYTLNTITKDTELKFKNTTVTFYQTTHSIPESVGMAFETEDGVIVYSPDYTFDQNVNAPYKTSFEGLARIANKKVLALLTESLGAESTGHASTGVQLDETLKNTFEKSPGRIIVSLFSTDIYRIQKVVDIALELGKTIAVIGRKAQRMVDIALNLGVLKIPENKLLNLKFIDEKNKNTLENSVVLVTGDRHEPFFMLQRMVRKIDRLIHLNQSDNVVMMTPPIPGTEKIAARTLDILSRNNISMKNISRDIMPSAHASSEDIKLLLNFMNPTYVVPVIGEFRHFYATKQICLQQGYKEDQIKLLENGQILRFKDGKSMPISSSRKSGDVMVDGIMESDLSDIVLKDREILSQDGLLLIIAHINAKQKKMVGTPEVVSRGFVYMKENEDLIREVGDIYKDIASKMLKENRLDWKKFKEKVRQQVSKFLLRKTDRRPIVIPVIIDVNK